MVAYFFQLSLYNSMQSVFFFTKLVDCYHLGGIAERDSVAYCDRC